MDKYTKFLTASVLLLFLFILYLAPWRLLFEVFSQNSLILSMLLPFVVMFSLLVYLRSLGIKYFKDVSIDTYLTLAGILLAVLFFIFTNFQTDSQKLNVITSVNTYNCELASSTVQQIEKTPNTIVSQQFITDIYTQNLGFVFEKDGFKGLTNIENKLYVLNVTNGLINIIEFTGAAGLSAQTSGAAATFVLGGNGNIKGNLDRYFKDNCQ